MMKYLMYVMSLFFLIKDFWMVQMMILLFLFIFIMSSLNNMGFWVGLGYSFGMDWISFGLIILSIWISVLMILASYTVYNYYLSVGFFILNILFMLFCLICVFSSLNLFVFYLFFESSLIPILLLIFGWGFQPERIQAGVYLLFYTLFMSLPMLIGIFYIYEELNMLNIYFFYKLDFNYLLLYMLMIMSFLVKMPMAFMHLWLPKAHVEAPVSGSMILAGVMLKLGGYGLMRIMIMFQSLSLKVGYIIIGVSLIGSLYLSLLCLHQIDLKSLVAYSSVVHMGLVLGGLMILTYWSFSGSYIILISHGLCSSALFCLVNLNYERLFSRSFYINKGMISLLPTLSLWWFLFLSCNMAAPPSLNLLGEISLFNSLMSWSYYLMWVLMLLSFFSALYSLFMFIYSQYGKFVINMNNFYYNSSREFLLMLLHWIPLNFLVLKIDWLIMYF